MTLYQCNTLYRRLISLFQTCYVNVAIPYTCIDPFLYSGSIGIDVSCIFIVTQFWCQKGAIRHVTIFVKMSINPYSTNSDRRSRMVRLK